MLKKEFLFIALSPVGQGLSGGDRIFIEFARNLEKGTVSIVTWRDGRSMCEKNGLDTGHVNFIEISVPRILAGNFLACYLTRIFLGIYWALFTNSHKNKHIIYCASEFLMDVIPSLILKIRKKKLRLICTWFQTAPNPFQGYTEGERRKKYRFNALLYWTSQKITKPFIENFANYVLVNNEDEKKRFPILNKKNRLFVVLGGVDVERINNWKKKNNSTRKVYDGVFQGRFHAQKGVEELVEIWKKVTSRLPDARLAMIGDGPLMSTVERRIKENNLAKNIDLLGYVFDGDKKYSIFQSSKLVLHPAFYDSGGMASAEAMMFGIPVIGFDLVSYKSYYPRGMVKVKIGNLDAFAHATVDLLENEKTRLKLGNEAEKLVTNNFSWDKKTKEIFSNL